MAKASLEKVTEQKKSELDPQYWLKEYGNDLYRYAFLRLRNEQQAEDVVQEALLSAYKARDSFEGKSSIKTWLITIVRNKSIDLMRKQKRDALQYTEQIEEDGVVQNTFNSMGIWSNFLSNWGRSPDDLCEHKGFVSKIQDCLEKLPENLRQVFILKNVDQLETDEICERLDITPNNVWVMLYRSRLRLRECVDKNWFDAG